MAQFPGTVTGTIKFMQGHLAFYNTGIVVDAQGVERADYLSSS